MPEGIPRTTYLIFPPSRHLPIHGQHVTIASIAYQLGFSESCYLSRVFRQELATPPSMIRNASLGNSRGRDQPDTTFT